jgi:hypothetical protein
LHEVLLKPDTIYEASFRPLPPSKDMRGARSYG